MGKEASKCRAPVAAELNKLGVWLPFPNVSFMLNTDAYRGRPDGEYRSPNGRVIDVEFKAAIGSVYLGDPDDPASTQGFHVSQRIWHHHIQERSKVPYCIVLFAYEDKKDKRMSSKKSAFYVVDPEEWYALEETIKQISPEKIKRTAAISKGSERLLTYRHISLEEHWASRRFESAAEAANEIHRKCNYVN